LNVNIWKLSFGVIVGVVLAGGAWRAVAQDKPAEPAADAVIVTWGDQKMTYGEFKSFLGVLPPEAQKAGEDPAGKRQLVEERIKQRILAGDARARGLDKDPRFLSQVQIMQDNILVGLLLQQLNSTLVSDDEIRKYYDDHKAEMERVTVRHILLATVGPDALKEDVAKAKADAIKKRLDAGEDFAAVAKAESSDPGSKDDGGKLPRFQRNQMVKEFEDAAFALKPGEVSAPVKTQFGYHIIKLESRDTATFEEAKDAIADNLRQVRFETQIADKIKAAAPKYDEKFFGPAPATAPAGGGDVRMPGKE
jgi:peptidyl-prolyl cis-trans isomerase C